MVSKSKRQIKDPRWPRTQLLEISKYRIFEYMSKIVLTKIRLKQICKNKYKIWARKLKQVVKEIPEVSEDERIEIFKVLKNMKVYLMDNWAGG